MADGISAEQALERLIEGNASFVEARSAHPGASLDLRRQLKEEGQSPFAVIITCSDSRVIPELAFSCSLGEIFVVRGIGGEVDSLGMASIIYGCEHLDAKLVVELGHTHCGAVDTALGHLSGDEVDSPAIRPYAERIAEAIMGAADPRAAELANVRANLARIRDNAEVAHLMGTAGVEVRGALYDIESGKVEFLAE